MARKGDPKEVVDFAFIPVGRWPDRRYRWDGRMLFAPCANAHFQTQYTLIRHRKQVIYHIEARQAFRPLYCCHTRKEGVLEIFVKICANRDQVFWIEYNSLLTTM